MNQSPLLSGHAGCRRVCSAKSEVAPPGSAVFLIVLASSFGRRLDCRKCGRDTSLGRKAPHIDLSIGLCAEALAEPSDTGGQELPRLGEPGATVFGFECVSPVHPPVVDFPTQTRDRESRQPPDSVPP